MRRIKFNEKARDSTREAGSAYEFWFPLCSFASPLQKETEPFKRGQKRTELARIQIFALI